MSNVIVVTGNVGRDTNIREFDNGDLVADFPLADNWQRGDEEHTNWFRVSCWGATAEFAEEYVLKGVKLIVTGQLRIREYETENEDGEVEIRQSHDIYASRIEMVTWPENDEEEEDEDEEEEPPPRRRKNSRSHKRQKETKKKTPARRKRRRDEDYDDEEEERKPRKKRSATKKIKSRVKPRSRQSREEEEEEIDEDEEYEDMEWEDD